MTNNKQIEIRFNVSRSTILNIGTLACPVHNVLDVEYSRNYIEAMSRVYLCLST